MNPHQIEIKFSLCAFFPPFGFQMSLVNRDTVSVFLVCETDGMHD